MSILGQLVLLKNTKYFNEDCGKRPFWKICIPKGFAFGPVWIIALLAAFSHIFIDIRFEPYGFAYYPDSVKIILSLFYGIIMGGGFWLAHEIIRNEFKHWALWKEVLWLSIMIFVITNVNFLFRQVLFRYVYDLAGLYPIYYWRYMLIGVEVAGTTALVFKFIQLVLLKSGLLDIGMSDFALQTNKSIVKIYDQEGDCIFNLKLDHFIYAESEGNYINLYCTDGNHTIRLSLTSLEEQLSRFPNIRRVQKSYLVNFYHHFSLEGNSRKAFLVYGVGNQVPVSRSFYKQYHEKSGL